MGRAMSHVKKYVALGIPFLLIIANGIIWYAVRKETPASYLTVAFLDIGQGDSIYIESPHHTKILVDAGAGTAVLGRLGKVMPFYARRIDAAIATHPDKDHIEGFMAVLRKYKVGKFLESGVSADTSFYAEIEREVAEQKIPKFFARRGMRINLDEDTTFTILFPDRDTEGWETNDASIVARLTYGDSSFLLTGDSPSKIEEYLISLDPRSLSSNVLKAGHHGSNTSSSQSFIDAVRPAYTVISSGKDNRYGHPHPDVVSRLEKSGTKILNTATEGTIIFRAYKEGVVENP